MKRFHHILRRNGFARREFVGGTGEIGDEDGGGFRESEDGVFLKGCVGREDAAGDAGGQGARKEEVLEAGVLAQKFCYGNVRRATGYKA